MKMDSGRVKIDVGPISANLKARAKRRRFLQELGEAVLDEWKKAVTGLDRTKYAYEYGLDGATIDVNESDGVVTITGAEPLMVRIELGYQSFDIRAMARTPRTVAMTTPYEGENVPIAQLPPLYPGQPPQPVYSFKRVTLTSPGPHDWQHPGFVAKDFRFQIDYDAVVTRAIRRGGLGG